MNLPWRFAYNREYGGVPDTLPSAPSSEWNSVSEAAGSCLPINPDAQIRKLVGEHT